MSPCQLVLPLEACDLAGSREGLERLPACEQVQLDFHSCSSSVLIMREDARAAGLSALASLSPAPDAWLSAP